MKQHILVSIRITLALLVIVSGVYPLVVWGIGQMAFRNQANGSLIVRGGRIAGSSLIGQSFTSDRYFHSRPSAVDFNAQASGGSNLGPTSKKLRDRIAAAGPRHAPADAVTASASGLDPHISPENALLQIPRIARSRKLTESQVRALVQQHTEGRFLGVYGEPRVNVFLLNLALDAVTSSSEFLGVPRSSSGGLGAPPSSSRHARQSTPRNPEEPEELRGTPKNASP